MFLVGPILVIFLLGLRYLMPISVNQADITLTKEKFRKIYLATYLIWIVSVVGISTLIYFLLNGFESASSHEYKFDLYPDSGFWIGVSVLSGISIGTIALFALLKAIYKELSDEFWAMYDSHYKFRATSFLKGLVVLFASLGIVFIVLGKNAEFKVYPDKIKVSKLFEFSAKEYSFDDIDEINQRLIFVAPNGKKIESPYFEIVFKDAYSWHTRMGVRESQESDPEVFSLISNYSGKKINILDY